jgi:hypothetical protein
VYNLVGWGLPLTLTLITLILQYLPTTYTAHLIIPGIGKESIANCLEKTVHFKIVRELTIAFTV